MSEDAPSWRRALEADAAAGKRAQQELAELREQTELANRELALRRAGVDVDSPLGEMFSRDYDGVLEVGAIQEAASAVGAYSPEYAPQSFAALDRISNAAGGGQPSGGYAPDFEAKLDSIPLIGPDGTYNPDYVNQVLAATAEQAAREGRQFGVVGNGPSGWRGTSGANVPSTKPMQ